MTSAAASRLSFKTMRILSWADSSLASAMPVSSPDFTRSLTLASSADGLAWYGSAVMTI